MQENGPHNLEEIKNKIFTIISTLIELPVEKIDPSISFFEYGLDSLHLQELVAEFEKWYGDRLSEDILIDYNTIDSLADYLFTLSAAKNSTLTGNFKSDNEFKNFLPYQELKQRQVKLGLSDDQTIFFDVHEGVAKDTTIIQGRQIINFASYNYLGLSGNPKVNRAAINAIKQYGTSVSASRLVSGQKPLHQQLEDTIANFIGVEDCLVFNNGYGTNVNTISHLFNQNDLILHDELAHNSIIQGAVFSRAKRLAYRHNDFESIEKLLAENRTAHHKALIITEGVFSMDGDYPDLPALITLKEKYAAMIMIDEAHSLGTLGATGRGISEHFHVDPKNIDIWMGTLSKALASCGGYIAGSNELITYLKFTCPGFVFSAGISPPDTAAALCSLQILEREPKRVQKLQKNAAYAFKLAQKYKFDIGSCMKTAIIPIIIGDSKLALNISMELMQLGFNIKPIIYPAVSEAAARLRIFVISSHSKKQIKSAFEALNRIMRKD